jgi:hypothetical protein
MPSVRNVERRIFNLEGFDVVIRGADGHDMRDDAGLINSYPNRSNKAKNSMTVASWKEKHFETYYRPLKIDVLDGNGEPCLGTDPAFERP